MDCCVICNKRLQEPYIECFECFIHLCVNCFSNGSETEKHKNSHSYIILHNNLIINLNSNWNAREEIKLLQLILKFGYGNWDDIGSALQTRSGDECRDHYHQYYFSGVFSRITGLQGTNYFPVRNPYMYKRNSLEPPRPDLDDYNFQILAGYRCARSDFDKPYDNSAQAIFSSSLNKICLDEDQHISADLQFAIILAYNNRLRERRRRYMIIRNHGLLLASKTLSWLAKNAEAIGTNRTNARASNSGRFVAFMQLMNGITFDSIVAALQYAQDLKKYLFRLYDLRKNGVCSIDGGKLYHKLRAKRLSRIRDKQAEQVENILDWKNLIPKYVSCVHSQSAGKANSIQILVLPTATTKRKSTPLNILGLPAFDRLTEDEKLLCSTVRLVPTAYLNYKDILTAENTKAGYLRLADARKLIKIDVNKTRQVFDFLMKCGYINDHF